MDNSELIKLLEAEMAGDIGEFDVPPQDEQAIDLAKVMEWYVSAEKLIRVLSNIFSAPVFPSINQLRYAGHHILKAQLCGNTQERQSNLIEAFKHCKRAVYDAFDFYIYRLNEYYRSLLPYLSVEKAVELEQQVKDLLMEINDHRDRARTRIAYYTGVQKSLVKGLEMVASLNKLIRESGLSEEMLKSQLQLGSDIVQLRSHLDAAQTRLEQAERQVARYSQIASNKGTVLSIAVTVGVAIATYLGLTANAGKENKQVVTFANPVVVTSPQQMPQSGGKSK